MNSKISLTAPWLTSCLVAFVIWTILRLPVTQLLDGVENLPPFTRVLLCCFNWMGWMTVLAAGFLIIGLRGTYAKQGPTEFQLGL